MCQDSFCIKTAYGHTLSLCFAMEGQIGKSSQSSLLLFCNQTQLCSVCHLLLSIIHEQQIAKGAHTHVFMSKHTHEWACAHTHTRMNAYTYMSKHTQTCAHTHKFQRCTISLISASQNTYKYNHLTFGWWFHTVTKSEIFRAQLIQHIFSIHFTHSSTMDIKICSWFTFLKNIL